MGWGTDRLKNQIAGVLVETNERKWQKLERNFHDTVLTTEMRAKVVIVVVWMMMKKNK